MVAHPIPQAFWHHLKSHRLLPGEAPTPGDA
jgi:hypothetical protein